MTLAPDANPCAEATDNWLLLITGGRLELSHAHAAEGDAEGHPAKAMRGTLTLTLNPIPNPNPDPTRTPTLTKAKRGALMARFELEAGSAGEEL